jgi:hypothetical protein
MKFTEDQLKQYAAPLSDTEDQQCKNAIRMIGDALKFLGFSDDGIIAQMYDDTSAYQLFLRQTDGNRKIKIFVQGSYANNTNVRTQSDVDIAVVQEELFSPEYRSGISNIDYGFSDAPNPIVTFKDEVQAILIHKFGLADIKRNDKSIKINGNSYRKDADTVPSIRHRNYSNNHDNNPDNYICGIVIYPDSGGEIINYPEQHIKNGIQKNNETNYYYKKMVRVIKKIRYIMQENRIESADDVSSFGLESLLWNIPNNIFTKDTIYCSLFGKIVDYLYINKLLIYCYKEANGIKDLCIHDLRIFGKYVKFVEDLKKFYEYDI